MKQDHLFQTIPCHKYDLLSKEEIVKLCQEEEKIRSKLIEENKKLRSMLDISEQKTMILDDQYVLLKNKIFGRSSEKSEKRSSNKKNEGKRGKRVQLPSKRYPNVPITEQHIEIENLPQCNCCNGDLKDTGITEDSEYLTVIPAIYMIIRQKRHKYKCTKCHGNLITANAPKRIIPGSSYSDEMILDVGLSKYCDLIPMERYVAMAGRKGLMDLPPQSLIGLTHHLANYVEGAANKVKEAILAEKVLYGDESPHKMLEGDARKTWYLWAFSSSTASYFDIQNSRSGDIVENFLEKSNCQYLMSDAYTAYKKAVTQVNKERGERSSDKIINIFCNSHSRRKFKQSENNFKTVSKYFIKCYKHIYRLENLLNCPEAKLAKDKIRKWQMIYFKLMERKALSLKNSYSHKSSIGKAIKYFLKHYSGLTYFINHYHLPIDNNSSERLIRDHVVGRKTWYGTHSKRGAKTASILLTLIQSCKLIKVNPREYFKELVNSLHSGDPPFTPYEYMSKLFD